MAEMKQNVIEERHGLLHTSSSRLEFEDNDYHGSSSLSARHDRSTRYQRPFWQYLLACLVLVGLTELTFIAYISHIFSVEYFDDSTLPLANPYIGLKELYDLGGAQSSPIDPLLNRPKVVTQVYRDEPNRVGSRGGHEVWDQRIGRLSPYDRHFVVNETTRTIIQFRAMDFGMEECALVMRLPDSDDAFEGKDLPVIGDGLQFRICPLDVPQFLDPRTVTWSTKPACASAPTEFVGRVGAEYEVLPRFVCPWASYHSYEVACADESEESCQVDVWSSHNQTWGIYMYQYQTV